MSWVWVACGLWCFGVGSLNFWDLCFGWFCGLDMVSLGVSFPGVVVASCRCMVGIVMVAGIVGRGCCFLGWFARVCSGGL